MKASGVVRVWSKESGLGPDGIGLRGFKPHTPHQKGISCLEVKVSISQGFLSVSVFLDGRADEQGKSLRLQEALTCSM